MRGGWGRLKRGAGTGLREVARCSETQEKKSRKCGASAPTRAPTAAMSIPYSRALPFSSATRFGACDVAPALPPLSFFATRSSPLVNPFPPPPLPFSTHPSPAPPLLFASVLGLQPLRQQPSSRAVVPAAGRFSAGNLAGRNSPRRRRSLRQQPCPPPPAASAATTPPLTVASAESNSVSSRSGSHHNFLERPARKHDDATQTTLSPPPSSRGQTDARPVHRRPVHRLLQSQQQVQARMRGGREGPISSTAYIFFSSPGAGTTGRCSRQVLFILSH